MRQSIESNNRYVTTKESTIKNYEVEVSELLKLNAELKA
jgi:hypothetical protein